ncbi:unnamed protein product [Didymodactylos carnosus]|uniref:Uncharacterized protein n=1 Tax=Didymodactylos carnosus TaxID=1234261 RepID=A0A8S2IQ01_9BILA|nr:unnamed protein product [Didymodactylos carnosus]CAF3758743.1 unnamed protein product [Didymodactylos carnosus]
MSIESKSTDHYSSIGKQIYEDSRDGMTQNIQVYLDTIPIDDINIYLNILYEDDTEQKCTALIIACKNGHYEIVKMFLTECKPDLEIESVVICNNDEIISNATALWIAFWFGHLSITQLLVEHGANINHSIETNVSPLQAATYAGHIDIVQYLVEQGADIHHLNVNNETLLMLAAYYGHTEIVDYFLQLGCDPNIQNYENLSTALHLATEKGHWSIVQLLLSSENVNRNIKNSHQMTPLMIAAEQLYEGLVDYFIENRYCTDIEQIEALELLGTSYYCYRKRIEYSYDCLLRAMKLREKMSLSKTNLVPAMEVYNNYKECQTQEELKSIRHSSEALKMEVLMIRERILGQTNPQLIYPLKHFGQIYAGQKKFTKSLQFLLHALNISEHDGNEDDILLVFSGIFFEIIHHKQCFPFQVLHHVMLSASTDAHTKMDNHHVRLYCKFPSLSAVQLLTDCGGLNINALNVNRNTPLHIIASYYGSIVPNKDILIIKGIIQTLNEANCHWDIANQYNQIPLQCTRLRTIELFIKDVMKFSLKCLVARHIRNTKLKYYEFLSQRLCDFIELH